MVYIVDYKQKMQDLFVRETSTQNYAKTGRPVLGVMKNFVGSDGKHQAEVALLFSTDEHQDTYHLQSGLQAYENATKAFTHAPCFMITDQGK